MAYPRFRQKSDKHADLRSAGGGSPAGARSLAPAGSADALSLEQLFRECDALRAAGEVPAAIECYRQWLSVSVHPQRPLVLFNLGALLQGAGDVAGAAEAYRESLILRPHFAEARINLGLVHERMGQTHEALAQWADVVAQRHLREDIDVSTIVLALNHIGRVQENLKRYVLAEQALEQSLQLHPKQPHVIQHWVHVRQKACMWPVYKTMPGIRMNDLLMATSPLAMLALTDNPLQQLLTAHAFVTRTYPLTESPPPIPVRHHQRLRLGYVSGDLCVHAVGLLLGDFFEAHDRSKFELYAYDFSPEDGTPHQQRLRNAFDHRRPIHQLSDENVAALIKADEIDILIDLHGLSSGARPGIFARRPAPLQGTYLGFIGTTAMPWFDFVITDRQVTPDTTTDYFKEAPLYVDGSFLPLSLETWPVRQATRSEFGLPDEAWVMAAFGNSYKINPALFDRWLSILQRLPHAVLWLIDDNPAATKNLRDYASRAGADLHRIVFSPRSGYAEYRAGLRVADVFLDTYPYNCGSTTNDVIQARLPIVTVGGDTMVSRMGTSILRTLNLPELIANDLDDYENRVVQLAQGQINLPADAFSPHKILNATRRMVRSLEHELLQRFERRGYTTCQARQPGQHH
jgi:predicted O-linked N-acetylglucosamine transferase (SPINDLY family)